MISPAIAGNDSRYGMALRVFLGGLSAISCQYPDPIGELSIKRFRQEWLGQSSIFLNA
jgi:hypothetical protein